MPRISVHASPRDRYAAGKRLRERLPRQAQAEWTPAPESRDRFAPLRQSERGRLTDLIAEKNQRMNESAFGFFRGSAPLMAADLATLPRTGATVQLCGDAHVRNLGAYAALDGTIVFDINDFDETFPGPWEWDVKRLATSLVLAGEESKQSRRNCAAAVMSFVSSYRVHLRTFASMRFATLARHLITRRPGEPLLDAVFRDARRVTPLRNLEKLTARRGGHFRFHDKKDVQHTSARVAAEVLSALKSYRTTLSAIRRHTFERYRAVDVAFKVVGTGSVGTRDYVVLLFGNGVDDPLFIQVKQELPSCYAPYLPDAPPVIHEGRRVAEGQQLMQTLSDPFLGYTRFGGHDYLVRQLADHKAAIDPETLTRRTLTEYAQLCGETLAKGHARSGDAALLSGYVGRSAKLDRAITAFALTYADQVKRDHQQFKKLTRKTRDRKP